MIQLAFAFLVMFSLASMGARSANAAQLQAGDDATVERLLRENPGFGVLIVDLVMREDLDAPPVLWLNNGDCTFTEISLVPTPLNLPQAVVLQGGTS